ncbi:MAG: response regulator of the LytR/AlgR family [Phenylobacterium sp.]|nr:response regulator of the LytR/AlgR family [Phenylobacterium sp.]
MAWPDRATWTRTLGAATAIGLLFSVIGAFGSAPMPIVLRTVFMIALSLIASALGVTAFVLTGRAPWVAALWWRRGIAAGLLMTPAMAVVVWAALKLVVFRRLPLSAIAGNLPTSAATSIFFCLWVAYQRQRGAPAAATAAAPAPPKFLERLPLKLRGAELWAVEAEDHYLRLHTSKGQDLILMRLSDAVAELEGIEGAQAHRSWWVARDAITDVRRADGRATLTLKDGGQVPVSRANARLLRERGWF